MELWKEFLSLGDVRKRHVFCVFLATMANAFIIAISLTLVIELFGSDGAMMYNYAASAICLIMLVPYLAKMASKNPRKAIRVAIFAEFASMFMYSFAELGYYPHFLFILATAINFVSNNLMSPPRVQMGSAIIAGEKEYSIFIDRVSSLFTALGALVGLSIVLFELSIFFNIVGLMVSLGLARYFSVKNFDEIFELDGEIDENKMKKLLEKKAV